MVVVGTRPEIIKMAPIVRELRRRSADFFVVHTGQHYDWEMSTVFFEELRLSEPDYYLNVKSGSHGVQTGKILERIEGVIEKESPDLVMVVGDTNSALGAALAAAKMHVCVAHVEAGCRSYDRRMPEEINRELVARVASLNFAPSPRAYINLLMEGIPRYKVFLVGHPIVDLLYEIKDRIKDDVVKEFGLTKYQYVLATFHRAENVDDPKILGEILASLSESPLPVIFPIHPRTRERIKESGLEKYLKEPIISVKPQPYLAFLGLLRNSRLVVTDSGGVQQEAAIIGIRAVTVRENIEWVETVIYGFNELVAPERNAIMEALIRGIGNPGVPKYEEYANKMFGMPGVARRIVNMILNEETLDRIRRLDEKMRKQVIHGYPTPKLSLKKEIREEFSLLYFDKRGECIRPILEEETLEEPEYRIILDFQALSKGD